VGLSHVACFWLTVGSWRLIKKLLGKRYRHVQDWDIVNVSFHGRAVWWSIWHPRHWHPRHSWSSKTPRWRHGSFHWWRFLVGEPIRSAQLVDERRVGIPMPEGVYEANAKVERVESKPPRWPWPKVWHHYNIDVM